MDIGLSEGWVLRNSLEDCTTSSYVVSKVIMGPSLFNSAFGSGNSSFNSIFVPANSSMTDFYFVFNFVKFCLEFVPLLAVQACRILFRILHDSVLDSNEFAKVLFDVVDIISTLWLGVDSSLFPKS